MASHRFSGEKLRATSKCRWTEALQKRKEQASHLRIRTSFETGC